MGATYDFDTVVDRRGTWCVQWDGVADRFGVDGLLPFTISDMDFATAPEVLAALRDRLEHGVFGYTTWQQDDFRSAIAHWYATRYDTTIDTGQLVYGPSVLNQLSQLLRMWTAEGDGVVVHTPTYDGFRKAITGLGRELRGCRWGTRRRWSASCPGPTRRSWCCARPTTRRAGCGRPTSWPGRPRWPSGTGSR